MQCMNDILIVVDTGRSENTALERAKLIANVTGSTLHLLSCNKDADSQSAARLDALVKDLQSNNLQAKGHEAWQDNATSTIIHVQQAEKCTLIIKDAREENELSRAIFAPLDWKLLRQSPCPVLLVKSDKPWKSGKILASIDADDNSDEHKVLNEVILEYTDYIAKSCEAETHLATAHPAPMLSSSDPVYQNMESLEALYRDACQPYAKLYNLSGEQVHVGEGPAESYIPQLAEKLDISLVVMGTVARTGIKAAIVGNTAEQILNTIHCDVLTLKPVEIMQRLESEIKA